jgi:hypothetical protein
MIGISELPKILISRFNNILKLGIEKTDFTFNVCFTIIHR